MLTVENGVLNHARGKQAERADATLTMTRAALDQLVLGESTLGEKLVDGEADIAGSQEKLVELLSMLDMFDFWFNTFTSYFLLRERRRERKRLFMIEGVVGA